MFSNLTCRSSGPGCQKDGCGTDTLCVLVNQCFNYGGGLYDSDNQLIGSISYQSLPNDPTHFVLQYFNQTDCVGEMGVTNFVKGQDCEDPRPEVSTLQTDFGHGIEKVHIYGIFKNYPGTSSVCNQKRRSSMFSKIGTLRLQKMAALSKARIL